MFFSRPAGHKIVNRGAIPSEDFTIGVLIRDDAWHDLDLSAIIPISAVAVHINIRGANSGIARHIIFRAKGDTSAIYLTGHYQPYVTSLFLSDTWVKVGTNRTIQYNAHPTGWTTLSISILDWIK